MTHRPLAVYRIYPEPRKATYYVRAVVWPTKAAMQAHRPYGSDGPPIGDGTIAQCTGLTVVRYKGGRARALPIVAEVNFHRQRIDVEIIAHEMLHAAACWARRVRLNVAAMGGETRSDAVAPEEERFALALGRMARQFRERALSDGLYD